MIEPRKNTHVFVPGMRITWDEPNIAVGMFTLAAARERHGPGPFVVTEVLDAGATIDCHAQSVRIENSSGLGAWLNGAYFKPLEAAP